MPLRETLVHRILRRPHVLHAGFDSGEMESQRTVVFIHGLGRDSSIWQGVIDRLQDESAAVRYVGIDLLGFGDSPKPKWQRYDARMQARALRQTLKKLKIRGPVTVVGHSLGALVAVEYARAFPRTVNRLVLVSAPIYRSEPEVLLKFFKRPRLSERFYLSVLRNLRERQELTQNLNRYLRKARFFDPDFIVDQRNMLGVVRSIEMAIENQSAYEHIKELTQPIDFVYGKLDPYVIKKYYRGLARGHAERTVHSVAAGHEIATSRRLQQAVASCINRAVL